MNNDKGKIFLVPKNQFVLFSRTLFDNIFKDNTINIQMVRHYHYDYNLLLEYVTNLHINSLITTEEYNTAIELMNLTRRLFDTQNNPVDINFNDNNDDNSREDDNYSTDNDIYWI